MWLSQACKAACQAAYVGPLQVALQPYPAASAPTCLPYRACFELAATSIQVYGGIPTWPPSQPAGGHRTSRKYWCTFAGVCWCCWRRWPAVDSPNRPPATQRRGMRAGDERRGSRYGPAACSRRGHILRHIVRGSGRGSAAGGHPPRVPRQAHRRGPAQLRCVALSYGAVQSCIHLPVQSAVH